jgi:hypothetical protein
MAGKEYSPEFLAKIDEYVRRETAKDVKLGRFINGESNKAYDEGRLEEWFEEVTR